MLSRRASKSSDHKDWGKLLIALTVINSMQLLIFEKCKNGREALGVIGNKTAWRNGQDGKTAGEWPGQVHQSAQDHHG